MLDYFREFAAILSPGYGLFLVAVLIVMGAYTYQAIRWRASWSAVIVGGFWSIFVISLSALVGRGNDFTTAQAFDLIAIPVLTMIALGTAVGVVSARWVRPRKSDSGDPRTFER